MQLPLQITFRDFPSSPAIEARIRAKVEKLEHLFGRIVGCRVVLEQPHQHHHRGRTFCVKVEVTIPDGQIVASRDAGKNHAHEDVYVAIRDAFAAISRKLQDRVRRERGDVKPHEAPAGGRVVELFPDDGYGFIETDDGEAIYFHENSVLKRAFPSLELGSRVRLVVVDGESPRGPQASTVELA